MAKIALVIDHQPDVREALSVFLRGLDLIAIPVPNVDSAAVVSQRLELDLALVNLARPDSQEASVIARVRSQLPSKPIVVICEALTPGRREDCLRAGADAVVERPLDLTQLESVLRALLGASR